MSGRSLGAKEEKKLGSISVLAHVLLLEFQRAYHMRRDEEAELSPLSACQGANGMVRSRSQILTLCSFVFIAVIAPASAATYRTRNFVVTAANQQVAQQVAQYAEYYRKEKALYWLGQEMPTWGRPCPLKVSVTMGGSGGATSFVFDKGQILDQQMRIEGKLDRLLASVLPHEVTHTVFAYQYRQPVPRWADEGGSVLSEDELERTRHDKLIRNLLNSRRAMPLRRLFTLRDYPREVMTLYAQGYSVTAFLVARKGPRAFLRFLGDGMKRGWDAAVQANYGYRRVEDLEEAWLQNLANTRPGSGEELIASRNRERKVDPRYNIRTGGRASNEVVVRQTTPPAQPLLEQPRPTFRGQSNERRPFQPTSHSRQEQWSPSGGSYGRPRSSSRPNVQMGAPQPISPRWSPYGN